MHSQLRRGVNAVVRMLQSRSHRQNAESAEYTPGATRRCAMPQPPYSPVRLDTAPVYVISSTPRKDSFRPVPRPVRTLKPVAAPQPMTRLTTGLSSATVALALIVIFMMWKWHQASVAAEAEHRRAELSWAFADSVLGDLKEMRADASRLDEDRKDLLATLDKAKANGIALEADLAVWQQSHRQLQTETVQAVSQWTQHSQTLEQSLGSTESRLQQTATVLEQERQTAAQSISQLDSEKNAIAEQKAAAEREADALNRKASDLSAENHSLGSELGHARSSISSLESDRRSLESRNSQLCSDINSLRSTICSLESRNSQLCSEVSSLNSRISCLQSELSSARSSSNSSSSSDNDHHRGRR